MAKSAVLKSTLPSSSLVTLFGVVNECRLIIIVKTKAAVKKINLKYKESELRLIQVKHFARMHIK
jgi:hypothetical protein